MNVPEVVQMTSVMIAHIATLGPGQPVPPGQPERAAAGQRRGRRVGSTRPTPAEQQVEHAARVGEPLRAVDAEQRQERVDRAASWRT